MKTQEAFLKYFQEQDSAENRVLLKIRSVIMHEFEQTKDYLMEKNAKLAMVVKT
jgi:hypothetical protein